MLPSQSATDGSLGVPTNVDHATGVTRGPDRQAELRCDGPHV